MEIMLIIGVIGGIGLVASFASGAGAGFTFIIVYLVGVLVVSWILSFIARRQQDYLVGVSTQDAAAAVRGSFSGMGWKEVDGRGMLNFQARGLGINSRGAERPVISVEIKDGGNGTTEVSVWTSAWNTQLGVMALCDRVVSKKFWLGRKLNALAPGAPTDAGYPAASPAYQPQSPVQRPQEGQVKAEQTVALADPRLAEGHPRQLAHGMLTSVGVSYLFYGPAGVRECFRDFVALAPVLASVRAYGAGNFLGEIPGQPGIYLLAFEAPSGSAIAVCLTPEQDSDFSVEQIAMRLRDARPPWQWGIGTVGGNVPSEFAGIVDTGQVVELSRLR